MPAHRFVRRVAGVGLELRIDIFDDPGAIGDDDHGGALLDDLGESFKGPMRAIKIDLYGRIENQPESPDLQNMADKIRDAVYIDIQGERELGDHADNDEIDYRRPIFTAQHGLRDAGYQGNRNGMQRNDDVFGADLKGREPLPLNEGLREVAVKHRNGRCDGQSAYSQKGHPDRTTPPCQQRAKYQGQSLQSPGANPELSRLIGVSERQQIHALVGQHMEEIDRADPEEAKAEHDKKAIALQGIRLPCQPKKHPGDHHRKQFGQDVARQVIVLDGRHHREAEDGRREPEPGAHQPEAAAP